MLDQISAFIANCGYSFTPDLTRPKKKWQEFADGEHKGVWVYDTHKLKDGQELLVFTIFDYRKGAAFTEKFCGRELEKNEEKFINATLEKEKEKARQEKERKWGECKAYCAEAFKDCQPIDSHPYLEKKGVRIPTHSKMRVRTNTLGKKDLLIPMQDAQNEFWGYQLIRHDGSKEFLLGQRLDSVFYSVGELDSERIYICEGVATALSIAESLDYKYAVVACFSSVNIESVARAIRGVYESTPIIVCADNDSWKASVGNTGLKAAENACARVDGLTFVLPDFSRCDQVSKPTDFNDLHALAGLTEVTRQISAVSTIRPHVIHALGFHRNSYYFTTTRNPQVQSISEFSSADFAKLAPIYYWESRFDNGKGKMDLEKAKFHLVDLGQKIGVFEPSRIKGRGVYIDNERLVIHKGNRLLVDNKEIDIQDFKTENFYDPRQKLNIPAKEIPSTDTLKNFEAVCKDLSFQNESDYKLLMGWLMLAPLSGALLWRPNVLLTAPAGTGKSTILNYIVEPLLHFLNPIKKEMTTEAGLRQLMGSDAGIFICDEFDTNGGRRDQDRLQNLINLVRVSSSGGSVARGTTGGKALAYNANFMTLFAGVNPPVLVEADRTRITELTLTKNYKREWREFSCAIDSAVNALGAGLFWLGVERVRNINKTAEVLHTFIGTRLGPRAGQQYGTLLSGYWHIQNENVITEKQAEKLVSEFEGKQLVDSMREDNDTEECFEHLLQLKLESGSERYTLAMVLEQNFDLDKRNTITQMKGVKLLPNGIFIYQNPELKKHFSDTTWIRYLDVLARVKSAAKVREKVFATKPRGVFIPMNVAHASREF